MDQIFSPEFGFRRGGNYAETGGYAIGCEAAEKNKKRAYQEIVSGELKSGTIRIIPHQCRDLLDEITVLQWGAGKLAQDDRFEDHCADAMLYAVRASRNWYRPPPAPLPAVGSHEWHEAERLRTREMILDRVKKRNKGKGWRRQ